MGQEEKKKEKVLTAVKEIIAVYDNPDREGLIETPERVFKFFEEFFAKKKELKIKTFKNTGYTQLVIESGIRFYSLCEHHLLPFFGYVYIGYLPDKKLIGLSKLTRIVDYFASNFTIQERLTEEIANFIWNTLEADWVGVLIKARHLCKEMRGVRRDGVMTTLSIKGRYYLEPYYKNEFLLQVLSDNRNL